MVYHGRSSTDIQGYEPSQSAVNYTMTTGTHVVVLGDAQHCQNPRFQHNRHTRHEHSISGSAHTGSKALHALEQWMLTSTVHCMVIKAITLFMMKNLGNSIEKNIPNVLKTTEFMPFSALEQSH